MIRIETVQVFVLYSKLDKEVEVEREVEVEVEVERQVHHN
jgi:hypothetical protein